jgi:hypothetical protein
VDPHTCPTTDREQTQQRPRRGRQLDCTGNELDDEDIQTQSGGLRAGLKRRDDLPVRGHLRRKGERRSETSLRSLQRSPAPLPDHAFQRGRTPPYIPDQTTCSNTDGESNGSAQPPRNVLPPHYLRSTTPRTAAYATCVTQMELVSELLGFQIRTVHSTMELVMPVRE